MRAALGVLVVLGSGLAFTGRGEACTLIAPGYPIEPRAIVADADAAFIGTLVDIRLKHPPVPPTPGQVAGGSTADPHIFTFRVEERIKGDLPERVRAAVRAVLGS